MLPFRIALTKLFRHILSIRVFGIYTLNDLVENIEKISILKKTGLMFEVHLVDHCNLNCKGCSHFSPVSAKKITNLESFKKDMKRLVEILSSNDIRRIRLLGGEPLLHPDAIEFIRITHESFPDAYVEFVTNGLLLLKQPLAFWDTCRLSKTKIIVTRYPIPIDTKGIEEKAKEHGVSLMVGPTHKFKSFKKLVFDLRGKQWKTLSHLFCFNYGYTCQLKDGRFYPCSVAAYFPNFSDHFNLGIEENPKNYIDIYSDVTKDDLYNLITKEIPHCRYCDIAAGEANVKWNYSKRDISEWTKEEQK